MADHGGVYVESAGLDGQRRRRHYMAQYLQLKSESALSHRNTRLPRRVTRGGEGRRPVEIATVRSDLSVGRRAATVTRTARDAVFHF